MYKSNQIIRLTGYDGVGIYVPADRSFSRPYPGEGYRCIVLRWNHTGVLPPESSFIHM